MQAPPPTNDPAEPLSVPPPTNAALPRSIRGARYVVAGLLLSIIIAVVFITYLRIEKQLRETLESQLTAVLQENTHGFSQWLRHHEEVAAASAALPALKTLAQTDHQGKIGVQKAVTGLVSTLAPMLKAQRIHAAALYSPNGELRTSLWGNAHPTQLGLSEGSRRDLEQRGRSSRLTKKGTRLQLQTLALVGPLHSPTAVLSVHPDLKDSALLPQALHSGSTYAFTRQGIMNAAPESTSPPRLPGTARQSLQSPLTDKIVVEDYVGRKNIPVVGAWRWLDRHGVGIATEVPQDEALSAIARLRRSFLVLVTLVGAAVLGFIALGRWTLRVREESLLMTRRLGRLARAIQPLSAALEHDPSAVVLVDNDGTVVYANAASHRVLGVNSPLLGGDVDAVFDGLHAELQAALISGRDSIVAQGPEAEDETVLVSSRSLTIDGNPHYLYMLRPVTQQVRRQEVEHWKKLIRVLSHELNNALAPITSLLSSARKVNQMTHQDPRLGDIFESIAERTGHLVSFIEGYREVARLPRPDQRQVDWSDFMTGLESQKKFKRIGTLPQRAGYFDPIQMDRVLVNVVNNSYEAGSSPDDVTIEIVEEPTGFRINVADRGSGMPEPVLKQAMLPFFSTKRTGTGVGLALSREIVEAHGGQLTLTNRDGGGLLVSSFLPHPVQPATHASRSRMPVSTLSGPEPEGSEISEPST